MTVDRIIAVMVSFIVCMYLWAAVYMQWKELKILLSTQSVAALFSCLAVNYLALDLLNLNSKAIDQQIMFSGQNWYTAGEFSRC